MSTVDGTSSSSNIYELINQQNQSSSTSTSSQATEDSDMFMRLMIAQLQNQDPTNPADTTDFMQQISNMSMVESINNLVTNIDDLGSSLLSGQAALQASSMVGRQVYIESDVAQVSAPGAQVNGLVSLETSASDVRISIYDGAGNLLDRSNMGTVEAGDHNFTWVASEELPAGNYQIIAEQLVGDEYQEIPLYMGYTVNSVTLGQNGIGMTVNTNAGSVSMDEVKQIG